MAFPTLADRTTDGVMVTTGKKAGGLGGIGSAIGGFLGGPGGAILGSIGGSIVEGLFGSNEAEENRKWQEYMANTAHQREVRDLRKAGLNPILSATGGAGAPTPSGNVAPTPNFSASGRDAARTIMEMRALEAQLENTKADTKTKEASADFITAQADNERGVRRDSLGATTAKTNAELREIDARISEIETRVRSGNLSNDRLQKENEALAREVDAYLSRAAPEAYNRQQINKIMSLDASPATIFKLLIELLKAR